MILVTGGTGSFGHAFVASHTDRLRVLSRDEEKQRAMAVEYPDVDYIIGDIRDRETVRRAMDGVTHVFHAAALKQVPPLERAPIEAVRTNILGTDNVCSEAARAGARVVTISTDKAVEPVGVMGSTKKLAEAVTTSWGFNVVRYGNVIGSRGSIVPIWREAIARGEAVRITDPQMTRFLITLDEALDLIDLAMDATPQGVIYVRKSPAASVAQLVRVIARDKRTVRVGRRPGEKLHEDLISPDEHVTDEGDHYVVTPGLPGSGLRYSSSVARKLDDDDLAALIESA
jgi:UDP-N-acetylglucosamine 4,6-dehydratase